MRSLVNRVILPFTGKLFQIQISRRNKGRRERDADRGLDEGERIFMAREGKLFLAEDRRLLIV